MNIVEKILARASGKSEVMAGENIEVTPDLITMYDWESISDYVLDISEKYGTLDTSKLIMYIDHKIPATNLKEQNFHLKTIEWCKKHDVPIYSGCGIGHQLTVEKGFVNPGDVVVHFDRHVNILGAVGAFSVGTRLELIMALSTGKFAIQVPKTIRIELSGNLHDGVLGRDVLNQILKDIGPDGAPDQVIEFGGPGAANISLDSRMTICCLAMFLGCTTAIFEPDSATEEYYFRSFDKIIDPVRSDLKCNYEKVLHYNLSSITPMIVAAPNPQDSRNLHELAGLKINQGYIGSCASGRLEDFEIAARILNGRKVTEGFRLNIIPCSNKILQEASRLGYIDILVEAGAFITSPTCDFCYGKLGALADGERAISTGTLNVPGRMGNVNSDIYIGSASSVAAAAVVGAIIDPREFL